MRLNFTPTILPDGLIHLKVAPEVSSLDFTNAVTLQGFTIPALSTRRVESEMDLRDGQTFAIAGLIDNQVQQQLERFQASVTFRFSGIFSRAIRRPRARMNCW